MREGIAAAGLVLLLLGALTLLVTRGAPAEGRTIPAHLVSRGSKGIKELPRGGTKVLPAYRVVSFYGAPQADALGALGTTKPDKAARRLLRQARPYGRGKAGDKPVYPAFELISTIALSGPGDDGKYRFRQPERIIRRYAREARRHDFLLLLDIQPGRATFIQEARRLRPWLRMRNVGLALDPEWNMGSGGVPGERIGSVGAGMINRVSKLMSKIAVKHRLPQKPLVVHRFTEDMVQHEGKLKNPRRVALVLNSDGFGSPAAKRSKYSELAPRKSPPYPGFKLFYEEDSNLMSPGHVLKLNPRPRFVAYE